MELSWVEEIFVGFERNLLVPSLMLFYFIFSRCADDRWQKERRKMKDDWNDVITSSTISKWMYKKPTKGSHYVDGNLRKSRIVFCHCIIDFLNPIIWFLFERLHNTLCNDCKWSLSLFLHSKHFFFFQFLFSSLSVTRWNWKCNKKSSPLSTNQHSKINVTFRRYSKTFFRDTINTMHQLHDSFQTEKEKKGSRCWMKVCDILVFIMCHMQFENGCFFYLLAASNNLSSFGADFNHWLCNFLFTWLSLEKS